MGVSSNTADGKPGQGEGTVRDAWTGIDALRPASKGRTDPEGVREDETRPGVGEDTGKAER